jgi:hypothetical protein
MKRRTARLLFAVLALALAGVGLVGRLAQQGLFRSDAPAASGEAAVAEAFEHHRSNVWVEVTGTVERVLPDDVEGARHQRFILRLPSNQTLLVVHNLDLASRAPVERGSPVTVRGEYEWNEEGGVIHWTHHDPDGRRPGGWIRVGERMVR